MAAPAPDASSGSAPVGPPLQREVAEPEDEETAQTSVQTSIQRADGSDEEEQQET
jgi:hypothetical protein